ncbi:hypothetical protein AKJ52_01255 [candidate division MSBL1 archaeon SCGC-AAA382C18]|uniref:Receptor ligand binding region domain-containing protein n=1 Tax=candidate division MSBL1 archaeon SCGC-AAA382C18 TaxID=1698281 RepID=A0A133VKM8_9EURY|nr:hypothetical protein AKJ52_01255 [candidate division MSBL1 archaeon SCGC-AAA382C18]
MIAGGYIAFSGTGGESGDGKVNMGMLMPLTGDLSPYGGPMRDGGKLAIEQINDAGGLLDNRKINLIVEDTETSETVSVDAASKLINVNNVPVIIGPAGSGSAMAIIDKCITNKVLQIGPSTTSPDFTTYDDDGYFYRTVPSDALQGLAMAKLAIQEEYETASTLVLNNAYGTGFEKVFEKEFEDRGGTILNKIKYDPDATTFETEVSKISEGNPDVIMLVSYPETGSVILRQAYQEAVMEKSDWLLSEGLKAENFPEMVGKTDEGNYIIDGFKGTAPDPRVTGPKYEKFKEDYKAKFGRNPAIFSPNTYDAVAVAALAIQEAGEAKGSALKKHVTSVANPPGKEVTDLGEAIELLKQGKEINYQGASGEITFDNNGDVFGKYVEWYVDGAKIKLGDRIPVVEE